jgi:hypothetical protein
MEFEGIYAYRESGCSFFSDGAEDLVLQALKFQCKKYKSIYGRRSVSQYVMVSGSRLEPTTRFLFSVRRLQVS